MRCPNCNAFVGEDEMFCGECGTRIVRPAAAPPAAEPVTEKKAGGAAAALLGGGAAVVVIVVLVVVVCLCLVVAAIGLGVCTPAPEPTFTPTATRVPLPTKTPTPRQPTPTARPPTPTFRPSPTSTVRPTPAVTGSVFKDQFDDETGGWNVGTGTRGNRYIKDGELHIEITQENSIVWCSHSGDDWTDMVVELDARQVAGPDNNDYGVMLRYQDTQNFYRVVISGEGRYKVVKYLDGQTTTLIDWKSSSAIKKGVATNHIKATCRGDTFELYVNDEKVDTFEDSDLDQGAIAVVAGSYSDPGVHVAFDNVFVVPGAPSFYDDFVDNRYDWPSHDQAWVEDGEYHMYDTNSAYVLGCGKAGIHSDFTMEAKIRKVLGSDGAAFGMTFRMSDSSNFYAFTITGDGRYVFVKRVEGSWEIIAAPTQADVINKTNSTNVLKAVCKGQSFELYINGEKMTTLQDDFLSLGKIGFHVDQNIHMAVDYVVVWDEE